MTDDVPFDKTFDLEPDRVREIAPQVRAIVANNPGPFTFKGTMSYIIGRGKVAILDPGPDDDAHIAALLDAVRGETVTPYFRHPHPSRPFAGGAQSQSRDRRQGFRARSAPAGAAASYRRDAPARCLGRHGFPSRRRRSPTARSVSGDGWTLEAMTTPGHTANHMAFAFKEADLVVRRRSCHGVVDHDRGAARRRHERLHGVAA